MIRSPFIKTIPSLDVQTVGKGVSLIDLVEEERSEKLMVKFYERVGEFVPDRRPS